MIRVTVLAEDQSTYEILKYEFYTEDGDELYDSWASIESKDDLPIVIDVWWCGTQVTLLSSTIGMLYMYRDEDENNYSSTSDSDGYDSDSDSDGYDSDSDGYLYESDGYDSDSDGEPTSDSDGIDSDRY